MKKLLLLFCFTLGIAFQSNAQKTVMRMQNTQARMVDVVANAHVQPLVVEIEVLESLGRIEEPWKLTKEQAEVEMSGDLSNIRSWALYMTAQKHHVDVIVAATFNVKTNETADGYDITVVGYPANFVNWRTADETDYEWIRMEKSITTDDRDKISAIVK